MTRRTDVVLGVLVILVAVAAGFVLRGCIG